MLYDLVKVRKGKKEVVMTDELPKVRKRKQLLSSSQRGRGTKNEYQISLSVDKDKFKKGPNTMDLSGGSDYPQRVR